MRMSGRIPIDIRIHASLQRVFYTIKIPAILEFDSFSRTAGFLIYASNEPKSVLARDLGDFRDNVRNSRSEFLIVFEKLAKRVPSRLQSN